MLGQHKQTIHANGMRTLKEDDDATYKRMSDGRRGK